MGWVGPVRKFRLLISFISYHYLRFWNYIQLMPHIFSLDCWKIEFEKLHWTNFIFCLFQTSFLLSVKPAKFKFEIVKKKSRSIVACIIRYISTQDLYTKTLVKTGGYCRFLLVFVHLSVWHYGRNLKCFSKNYEAFFPPRAIQM